MFTEYIVEKLLDNSLEIAKKILKVSNTKLNTSRDDIIESVDFHLRAVKNWSGEIKFNDVKKAKRTTDIFINLDILVYPRRLRLSRQEVIDSIPLRNIFDQNSGHIILLGQPGAGKTTSMKYLCQCLFYDPDFYSDRFSFPILIKLRDLNSLRGSSHYSIIIDQIFNILGLKADFTKELVGDDQKKWVKEKLVINFLNELKVLLILDGLDELIESFDDSEKIPNRLSNREKVINEIRTLATHLEHSTMIVTSRTGDFIYSIDNTAQYEICPLDERQISAFAMKWLNHEQAATNFVAKIRNSPFADTTIRPLTLAHLCAIYERTGVIPEKPKTIYRKVVNLLLEEWDQQKSVIRLSKYANFDIDRKFEFLCHLAYVLTVSIRKTVFQKDDLRYAYKEIYQDYGLANNEASQVVNELETHTGLFFQSGYEDFEFAHKSLQEYLTAEYIVKLPSIPIHMQVIPNIPNELAVAVAISSRPSEYLSELILHRILGVTLGANFLKSFMERLLLEKPDFNTSTDLGLALLLLLSKYIEGVLKGLNGKEELAKDEVINAFEAVVDLVVTKTPVDIIQSYYETKYIYRIKGSENIHCAVKRKGIANLGYPTLPYKIYIRDSFMKPPAFF